jgi:histone H3
MALHKQISSKTIMARTKQTANANSAYAKKSPFRMILKRAFQSKLAGARKPIRFKPGTVALRQIRKLQRTCDLLLPLQPFQRLIREIALSFKSDLRFEREALLAIQEAAEAHIICMFQHTQNLAIHSGRKTIQDKDLSLALHIRENETRPHIPPNRLVRVTTIFNNTPPMEIETSTQMQDSPHNGTTLAQLASAVETLEGDTVQQVQSTLVDSPSQHAQQFNDSPRF